jgi:acetyl esterase/lipase
VTAHIKGTLAVDNRLAGLGRSRDGGSRGEIDGCALILADSGAVPSLWQPRGLSGWCLYLLWLLIGVALGLTLVAMVYPLPLDDLVGLGGAVALFFPLHLLVVTVFTGCLALAARAARQRLAVVAFALEALMSAALALWPSAAVWRFAHQHGVAISLSNYFENAAHLNLGVVASSRSVVYGTAPDGTELLLDVWPATAPGGAARHPALVRMHGGAFVSGHRSDMSDWDGWFNSLGYTVFDVEYRLPPPVRWRDEVGDVKCALGWVAAHAADYAVDPARIGVTGFSAGANLAMLAAYSMGDPRLPPSCDVPPVPVRSVVNLYGNSESTLIYDTSPSRDMVHHASGLYVGGSPAQYPERHKDVSPLSYIRASSPPTISFLGNSDRIIPADQMIWLDQALQHAGVPSEAYLMPATDHGFDVNWGGLATQFARAKIARFLKQHN